jgi:hypothetical protein
MPRTRQNLADAAIRNGLAGHTGKRRTAHTPIGQSSTLMRTDIAQSEEILAPPHKHQRPTVNFDAVRPAGVEVRQGADVMRA